jgi:hypothetical protein
VVADPEFAGLYIFRDGKPVDPLFPDIAEKEVRRISQETGLPVYILSPEGCAEAVYGEQAERYGRGRSFEPEELRSRPSGISSDVRERYEADIFTDSPFDLRGLEEFQLVGTATSGREQYATFAAHRNPDAFKGKTEDVDGRKLYKITEFPGCGMRVGMYLAMNGTYKEVMVCRRDSRSGEERLVSSNFGDHGYIQLAHNTWNLNRPLHKIEDYLGGMKELIEKETMELKVGAEAKREFTEYGLKLLACHLYGFAEQADDMGDISVAGEARRMAESVLSYDVYKNLRDRRQGPNGEMKIKSEDLMAA